MLVTSWVAVSTMLWRVIQHPELRGRRTTAVAELALDDMRRRSGKFMRVFDRG